MYIHIYIRRHTYLSHVEQRRHRGTKQDRHPTGTIGHELVQPREVFREPERARGLLHRDEQRRAEPLDLQAVQALREAERRDDVQRGGPERGQQVDGSATAASYDEFIVEQVELRGVVSSGWMRGWVGQL